MFQQDLITQAYGDAFLVNIPLSFLFQIVTRSKHFQSRFKAIRQALSLLPITRHISPGLCTEYWVHASKYKAFNTIYKTPFNALISPLSSSQCGSNSQWLYSISVKWFHSANRLCGLTSYHQLSATKLVLAVGSAILNQLWLLSSSEAMKTVRVDNGHLLARVMQEVDTVY